MGPGELPEPEPLPGQLPGIVDKRGRLPMGTDYATIRDQIYGHRAVANVTMATLHYTDSPPVLSAEQVASAQLQRDAAPGGPKFPGLAYHYIVEQDGTPVWAWDIDIRVWHSAAPGKNTQSVGVCYIGNVEPNPAQILGMAAALRHAEAALGRLITIGGHMDDYATECPGPRWPDWKGNVIRAMAG